MLAAQSYLTYLTTHQQKAWDAGTTARMHGLTLERIGCLNSREQEERRYSAKGFMEIGKGGFEEGI